QLAHHSDDPAASVNGGSDGLLARIRPRRRLFCDNAEEPGDEGDGLDVADGDRGRRRNPGRRQHSQPDQHTPGPGLGASGGVSRGSKMRADISVECRQVCEEFGNGAGKVLALRGVDLDVGYGAMTLLVGPSGCGKTTLLSVVAGLLNTSGGEVKVLGEQIERLPGRQQILFRRKNLGFVFQQYNLLPALNAAEN